MADVKERKEYINRINMLITQSQAAFAERIGVNRDKVNNWLGGRSKPDVDSLIRISKEYGVSTDWILGIAPVEQSSPDVSIQGATKITGLSEESVEILNESISDERYIIHSFLDFLIQDERLYKIALGVMASVFYNDMTTEYDRIEAFRSVVPNLPKGVVLLDAKDACEYQKVQTIKSFSAFLDEYVSKTSTEQMTRNDCQDTEK